MLATIRGGRNGGSIHPIGRSRTTGSSALRRLHLLQSCGGWPTGTGRAVGSPVAGQTVVSPPSPGKGASWPARILPSASNILAAQRHLSCFRASPQVDRKSVV